MGGRGWAVVSGAAGFIGSHVVDRLLERGWEVIGVDNLVTGSHANLAHLEGEPRFRLLEQDVCQPLWVPGPVHRLLHLASPASPVDFPRIPVEILLAGTLGTRNLLELAAAKGARFLLASTSEVYGDPAIHPQPESYRGNVDPTGPRGCYDEAKRCAEAFTTAYRRTRQVDTRIVRIFNSILADEQVLYHDGSTLRREPVEVLHRRLGGHVHLHGYRVPAFGADGGIDSSEASALVGHPTVARCFEVRTRYGRSVRVTGDHSLFVEGPSGRPEARRVEDLRVGDRIAVAARVRVPEHDRRWVDLVAGWDAAGGDPWELLICHPTLGGVVERRRLELLAVLGEGLEGQSRLALRAQIAEYQRRCRLPLGAMRALSVPIPGGATVRPAARDGASELPRRVPLTDELLWVLGLCVAGGVAAQPLDQPAVRLSGRAEGLDRAARILERELGCRCARLGDPAAGPALLVRSRLLSALLGELGFDGAVPRLPGWVLGLPLSRLRWVLDGYRDGAPGPPSSAGPLELAARSRELRDDLIVALARFGLVASTEPCGGAPDRERSFSWRLSVPGLDPGPPGWDRSCPRQRLDVRRTGDLVWVPVTEIVEIPASPLVYDFCVPGRENFWAGSGVMVHNTYGPRMRPDDGRVVPNYCTQALCGQPLTVYGDGSQTRSLCYVDDLVGGLLTVLEGPEPGPFNVGTEDEVTMLELARLVRRLCGGGEIAFRPLPEGDPLRRRPDLTRIRQQLGWEPRVPLEEGLRQTIAYFRTLLGERVSRPLRRDDPGGGPW